MGCRKVKRQNPPHVHEYETRHGKKVFYVRRPGHRKVRLRIEDEVLPWSPRFMEAYERALDQQPWIEIGARRTVEGTVSQGLVGYYKSNFFTGLAISSQKMRRAELERFRNDHGDKRVVLMHSTAIQNILNGKTPAAQRNFRKALRGFIDYCMSVKLDEGGSTGRRKVLEDEDDRPGAAGRRLCDRHKERIVAQERRTPRRHRKARHPQAASRRHRSRAAGCRYRLVQATETSRRRCRRRTSSRIGRFCDKTL